MDQFKEKRVMRTCKTNSGHRNKKDDEIKIPVIQMKTKLSMSNMQVRLCEQDKGTIKKK